MRFLCGLLFLWTFARSSLTAHPPSPCPDIFTYEGSEPENNRWYGEISLRTNENLVGIRLDIELDRPSDLMVSWLGETTSTDNVKYTILNFNQKLRPGPPVLSRIMVKFNRSTGSPRLRFIRLNGRKICPEDTNYNSEYEDSSRPQKFQSTKRPDPEFGDNSNYGNIDEYPNTNNNNNNYNSNNNNNNNNNYRPTGSSSQTNGNNNNYRPTGSQSNGGGGGNSNRPKPIFTTTTTTTEDLFLSTTRKPNKGTTRNPYENVNAATTYRPSGPNTVSLQANGNNPNGNDKEQISGVIDQILNSNSSNNKTVIIAVINNGDKAQESNQNRPNGNNNYDRPVPTDNSEQSWSASSNNGNNGPFEQQTGSNSKPNHNQENVVFSSSNSQQSNSGSVGDGSCGEVKLVVPLVTAGQSTHRGQWPWHVALYLTEGINLSYHCGGSLVSKNKVITAAHCVTNKQNDAVINSSRIVVYLGKYHQLQYSNELGVQTKQVIRINVYPSYNSSNYLGDIAILTLSSDAEFTNYVTPVCLWDPKSDLEDVVGKEGTVVGWGYDENDTPTEELKMAKMPVVSHQTCLWSYPQFYSEFTSNKTFCAGFRNGTSVCNGDSGGGMVFNKNSRWYLRGIVSITVAKEGLRVCDTNHYVVFTDVSKYTDFIRRHLR